MTAAVLLVGGLVFAVFAVPSGVPNAGTRRLELLGNAGSSFTALLVLAAALIGGGESKRVLGLSAGLGVVLVLLALNGVLVDLTGGAGLEVGAGRAITRLATVVLAGFAVVLWYRSTPGGRPQGRPSRETT